MGNKKNYDLLNKLAEKYPAAFSIRGDRKPLKVDIRFDIITAMPGIDWKALRIALRQYCGSIRYLEAVIAGADRVDLDGNVVGKCSDEDREYATTVLMGRDAKRKAKADAHAIHQAKLKAGWKPPPKVKVAPVAGARTEAHRPCRSPGRCGRASSHCVTFQTRRRRECLSVGKLDFTSD
jgi:ProP effector